MSDLLLCLLIPLGGAIAVQLLGRWPNVRDGATVLTSLVLFGVVLRILPLVEAGERPSHTLIEVLPGIELGFEVEPLGMLFALVASGLWIVTSLYGFGYMRGHHEENQTRFFTCFAIAIFAALGVAFSRNLFTLFTFYEVLTFSTYPLVTHHGTEDARKAGRVYLGILVSTSVCFLLLAVIWTHQLAGTTTFTPGGILAGKVEGAMVPLLLALFVFGTGKAAVMPFHRWLPAAMVAPTPVSALLHAVTVLKVVVYIFGLDLLQGTGASTWLLFAASITILIASVVALTKDNLKARLAYSTVSQLSYIVLGAAFASTAGAIGAGMHIAMHAVGKITLFFCAGAVLVCAHKKDISQMHGLGRRMPLTFGAFAIGSMSIIGLPFSGGMWSKWFLGVGAFEGGHGAFAAVLMVSSLLSIAYLVPVFGRAFLGTPSAADDHGHDAHGHDAHGHDGDHPADDGVSNLERAHPLVVLPPVLTALGCVVLFFHAERLYNLLAGM